jgi:hypothetical protein
MEWRVGRRIPLNVYDDRDRPVCQCHSEAAAGLIVAAMNDRNRKRFERFSDQELAVIKEGLQLVGAIAGAAMRGEIAHEQAARK